MKRLGIGQRSHTEYPTISGYNPDIQLIREDGPPPRLIIRETEKGVVLQTIIELDPDCPMKATRVYPQTIVSVTPENVPDDY